ncbi:putative mitochondrial protein AtMg00310 [Bidens hawaiensis]|uniref:putative mitochondrial protein AtMg00310 n=1 Tax=Bidens hawaiensis TaxID=980011 RepID=UPI004049B91F
MENVVLALKCFFLASGLHINLHKSSLFGIGIPSSEVKRLANIAGCRADSLRFSYLGVPVGQNMARFKGWEPIIAKFQKRLAKWKMKNKIESICSRFFWGANENTRKTCWVKWNLVLSDKKFGGLGFGSLEAMNLALLYKWKWRFFNSSGDLWAKLITVIHGGSMDSIHNSNSTGIWSKICSSTNRLHEKDIIKHSVIQKKIGDGASCKFWKEQWVGTDTLASMFPHLFQLESKKDCSVLDRRFGACWRWE